MKTNGNLWRIVIICLVTAGMLIFFATPVLATDAPTGTPTISNIHANIYLLETGDVLIYGEYDIPYDPEDLPDDDASKTYSVRLIDVDNATQLGVIVPFPKFDIGYNEGIFGFYFSAADNLTTDLNYIIRISQSPAYFDSPQSWDYVMPLSSWTDATTQITNQAEVTINLIDLAEDLEANHDVTLLEASAAGTVLSDPTGETYFRGVIYGIQAMIPDLFLVQSLTWDTTDRDWDTTEFDEWGDRFTGTFIGTAADNTSGTYGLDTPTLMTFIFLLPIVIGAVVTSQIKWKRAESGYLFSSLALICVALMGWVDMALFATVFQLLIMYIGYLWFYSRTGDTFGSKMFSFMAFVWIGSTIICLIVEGSWLGTTEHTVINDLSTFTGKNIGGLIPIPIPSLYFFRGLARMLLWDYSFYTGMFEFMRYVWLVVLTGAVVWGLLEKFVPVFANFMRTFLRIG